MNPVANRSTLPFAGPAINSVAARAYKSAAAACFYTFFGLFLLAGCSALPDKPTRPTVYDFGPGPLAASTPAAAPAVNTLPPLAIAEVATAGAAIDNQAVLYRLGYSDVQELRPYSLARWSMPPSQLVRQRLREQLGQRRPIFNARESLALNRSQNAALPLQLRLDLEEFSHFFSTPDASVGLIRLRATLVEVTPAGERLVGQRNMVVQRPAPSGDAAGGVRALSAATDAAIAEIEQWLQQTAVR
jgi:cholesterol transport system auxiliary component